MIKKVVAIASFCVLNSFAVCEEPTTGTAVWQLAADGLGLICAIESKVCQLQADVDVGFAGTFTVAEQIFEKVCIVESQTDVIDSKVDVLTTYCGIPIYANDLPLTITTPERYFLAESLVYTPTGTGTNAITIATNNVTLDLNGYSITQASGKSGTANTKGILTNSSLNNIRIENGAIHDLTSKAISFNGNCSNILISNIVVNNVGLTTGAGFNGDNAIDFDTGCSEIVIVNSIIDKAFDASMAFIESSNMLVKNSSCSDSNQAAYFNRDSTNFILQDCTAIGNASNIFFDGTTNFLINNCVSKLGSASIRVNGCNSGTMKNCLVVGSIGLGISISASSAANEFLNNTVMEASGSGIQLVGIGTNNNVIIGNTLIENTSNIEEIAGTNAYLGNFAFNSTAVGDPNNTNYRISGGSNITGKFVTGSEGGSFSDFPTQWHNINMLP